jgi:hypothetical protein
MYISPVGWRLNELVRSLHTSHVEKADERIQAWHELHNLEN